MHCNTTLHKVHPTVETTRWLAELQAPFYADLRVHMEYRKSLDQKFPKLVIRRKQAEVICIAGRS